MNYKEWVNPKIYSLVTLGNKKGMRYVSKRKSYNKRLDSSL